QAGVSMGKRCRHCLVEFTVPSDDLEFLERVSPVIGAERQLIPAPTLCPMCRWQRRLMFRNERTLYYRTSSLSGKRIFSMHPEDAPFPVYTITEWRSDAWDAATYGRDVDFSRPFFGQFQELCNQVPHYSLLVLPFVDENSEYTNCAGYSKNCYLISQAEYNEDCYYARGIHGCKDCCDCLRINHCELCYECVDLNECYYCLYCSECNNSSECYFSSELRSCRYCFGCHSLVNAEYCIFNKQVSREEWEVFLEKFSFTRDNINSTLTKSTELSLKTPKLWAHMTQCENCTGDHIRNCRDSHFVFDSQDLDHCKYCFEVSCSAAYCQDLAMPGLNVELLYECLICFDSVYQVLFSKQCCESVRDLMYCDSCFPGVQNCFGCYGLQRKQYCLLNKAYSQHEYEKLVTRVISLMRETGEWGEFFPPELSPFGYNETIADEYFPLSRAEVLKRGWNWREEPESETSAALVVAPNEPVRALDESILGAIYRCRDTGKPYRVIKPELQFYHRMQLPLPDTSPAARHKLRVKLRNPCILLNRSCSRCKAPIVTTYAPERSKQVLCEACYLGKIY
ncbi:hypothetical protein OAO01_06815, partial [Oligoflexia bacterium]|nr:hypothetical protein [Oligoflexia bacterium]